MVGKSEFTKKAIAEQNRQLEPTEEERLVAELAKTERDLALERIRFREHTASWPLVAGRGRWVEGRLPR